MTLGASTCEKDLGVHVNNKLKFNVQAEVAANKGNKILGIIRRSFTYLDRDIMTQLFKALVRPHLEYGNSVWSPFYKKDITVIENVQRRATKGLFIWRRASPLTGLELFAEISPHP